MSKTETRNEPPREYPAPVWFVELYEADKRGDFARAADCQSELARLGWRVDRNPRRKSPRKRGDGR